LQLLIATPNAALGTTTKRAKDNVVPSPPFLFKSLLILDSHRSKVPTASEP
jgi:hypothetical protein